MSLPRQCVCWLSYALTVIACLAPGAGGVAIAAVNVVEITAHDITDGYISGAFSAVEVTQAFLDRIQKYEPNYNAFTWINPDALSTAALVDQELATTGLRGPLHGIPVVVKESIDVVGAPSTFGYAPFSSSTGGVDLFPAMDSTVVKRLKEAGAIILGKTNMPPFSDDGTRADKSWAGRTYNAVDRSLAPGGSSSGTATAVAASFAAWGLGEETGGSIQNPAAAQSLVGIKPTFGLVPNTGVVPLAGSTQDVIGPLARTVYDAALGLDFLAGPSAEDPKTDVAQGHIPLGGYTSQLSTTALEGKRIGLFGRGWYSGPLAPATTVLYQHAQDVLKSQGATLVNDPFLGTRFEQLWTNAPHGVYTVGYDFEKYLERLGLNSGPKSIDQLKTISGVDVFQPGRPLRNFLNVFYPNSNALLNNPDILPDNPAFFAAKEQLLNLFNQVMAEHHLDALVFPQSIGPVPPVVGTDLIDSITVPMINRMGTPGVTVPAGRYDNGSPFSLIFTGGLFSEPQLLAYAYDFEQATLSRVAPTLEAGYKILPVQVLRTFDGGVQPNPIPDGHGDSVLDSSSSSNILVGETDTTSAFREQRVTIRYDLPPLPNAAALLEKATIRIRLERVTGNVPISISLLHSATDDSLAKLASLFEDPSFLDTGVAITASLGSEVKFIDLDVTGFIRQDFAQDGSQARSSFRLQMLGDLIQDNASNLYTFTMPGGGLSPELTLSFIPEPSTWVLLSLAAVGGKLARRRQIAKSVSKLSNS